MPFKQMVEVTLPTYPEIRAARMADHIEHMRNPTSASPFGLMLIAGFNQVAGMDKSKDWMERRHNLLSARARFSIAREIMNKAGQIGLVWNWDTRKWVQKEIAA